MIILIPQSGTSLINVIKEAIKICQVFHKANMHSVIGVQFNDIKFSVNEKCTVENTLENVFYKIKTKYEREGGVQNSLTHNGKFWLEEMQAKKSK